MLKNIQAEVRQFVSYNKCAYLPYTNMQLLFIDKQSYDLFKAAWLIVYCYVLDTISF